MDICIVTPKKELERVCLLAKVLADSKLPTWHALFTLFILELG